MISIKVHSIESKCVTGPSNILFGGGYVCTFDARNFTGWGSEGVNVALVLQNTEQSTWWRTEYTVIPVEDDTQ